MKCPSCQSESKQHGDEPIYECPECGWFAVDADGTASPCEPPSLEQDRKEAESSFTGGGGSNTPSPPIDEHLESDNGGDSGVPSPDPESPPSCPPCPAKADLDLDDETIDIEFGFTDKDCDE